jgi:hypothetical protein
MAPDCLTKICFDCKIEKNVDEFCRNKRKKDGRATYCKVCDKTHRNTEKYKSYSSEWKINYRKNNLEKILILSAKSRASKKNIPFSIIESDIIIPEYCPILGLKLKSQRKFIGENSPTLDRIDNILGYIPGNIVVISNRANRLKNDATLEEIYQLSKFYLKNYKG